MAKENTAEKASVAAAALICGLFVINWVAGWAFGYPIVYCAARPLMPLFADLFYWLWLGSMVAFVWCLFTTGASLPTAKALALAFLAGLIPEWSKTLFGLGMGC